MQMGSSKLVESYHGAGFQQSNMYSSDNHEYKTSSSPKQTPIYNQNPTNATAFHAKNPQDKEEDPLSKGGAFTTSSTKYSLNMNSNNNIHNRDTSAFVPTEQHRQNNLNYRENMSSVPARYCDATPSFLPGTAQQSANNMYLPYQVNTEWYCIVIYHCAIYRFGTFLCINLRTNEREGPTHIRHISAATKRKK